MTGKFTEVFEQQLRCGLIANKRRQKMFIRFRPFEPQ